jgi:AraC-like DNA-binding protein
MRVIRRLDALPIGPGGSGLRTAALAPCVGHPDGAILIGEVAARTGAPDTRQLCIRTMRAGTEDCEIDRRRLSVDEDCYLIVNAGRACRSTYRGPAPVRPLVVFLPPRLVDEAQTPADAPLGEARTAGGTSLEFIENLRAHGDAVSRCLSRLASALDAGDVDAPRLEDETCRLLEAMRESERRLRGLSARIDCVKASTRQELLRRVLRAADFICSHYDQPITLIDIAAAASLSRFHLVRLFRQALGTTPHAYLRDKRLRVARRLLARPDGDLHEIAERAGLGSRQSLFRQLRGQTGIGGRALRRNGELVAVQTALTRSGSEECRIPV